MRFQGGSIIRQGLDNRRKGVCRNKNIVIPNAMVDDDPAWWADQW